MQRLRRNVFFRGLQFFDMALGFAVHQVMSSQELFRFFALFRFQLGFSFIAAFHGFEFPFDFVKLLRLERLDFLLALINQKYGWRLDASNCKYFMDAAFLKQQGIQSRTVHAYQPVADLARTRFFVKAQVFLVVAQIAEAFTHFVNFE